jgi:phosphodiesterase/alkaline phosphatase D-like protein
MTDDAKRIGLRGQKRYYYIFSIGTEVEHRGRGRTVSIGELMKSY